VDEFIIEESVVGVNDFLVYRSPLNVLRSFDHSIRGQVL
jgi:hypothetical protein